MKEASAPIKKRRRRKWSLATPKETSPQARRLAAAILEVLAGVRRPKEAAEVLATSLPRYYQLERRALLGLLAACEPAAGGPGPLRRVAALERENRQLKRECDRQQALVRATERTLGLVLPVAKPPSRGKPTETPEGNGSPRRPRTQRPMVRALKTIKVLKLLPEATAVDTTTPPVTAET